eukprot:CAMPEP_0197257552 /NCGR_PEP_ID=MMETSP1429-20130617/79066_1 /TAXON_ID=49237 /ORGANISM="Chaetoceros  sp., Strain UNC1202" /LENGTH=53 /DNA_ID=CAMNT_0042721419 /DNA_START=155 /DNA_END=313 /DNA_ORIENTATION=-
MSSYHIHVGGIGVGTNLSALTNPRMVSNPLMAFSLISTAISSSDSFLLAMRPH